MILGFENLKNSFKNALKFCSYYNLHFQNLRQPNLKKFNSNQNLPIQCIQIQLKDLQID